MLLNILQCAGVQDTLPHPRISPAHEVQGTEVEKLQDSHSYGGETARQQGTEKGQREVSWPCTYTALEVALPPQITSLSCRFV